MPNGCMHGRVRLVEPWVVRWTVAWCLVRGLPLKPRACEENSINTCGSQKLSTMVLYANFTCLAILPIYPSFGSPKSTIMSTMLDLMYNPAKLWMRLTGNSESIQSLMVVARAYQQDLGHPSTRLEPRGGLSELATIQFLFLCRTVLELWADLIEHISRAEMCLDIVRLCTMIKPRH